MATTMMRDYRKLLAVVAGLLFASVASAAPPAQQQPPRLCQRPDFPQTAIARGEEGIVQVAFRINADGTVERTVLLSSSGSPDIDEASLTGLSKCVFDVSVLGKGAVGRWMPVAYHFFVTDERPDKLIHKLASAAKDGDVGARYHLSLLLQTYAANDEERGSARTMLRSAAEQGHPFAQFILGRRYERGTGMEANLAEAMRWYEMAAAQGEVFAIERLQAGGRLTF